eukprot:TRINITY_DN7650_c0_g1_i1.p1 TRINITY_DN7650_c0_g1~~TRINITY_DN7650_c0_g1_i1.p1  ORF type:complete len:813 (-),score=153.11 TRINITY_DN7650_c0_g1_i1:202-2595(-)
MAAKEKENSSSSSAEASLPGSIAGAVPRVDVPASAVQHFTQPQVHLTIAKAAKLLGFDGQEELKKYVTPLLKQFEGAQLPLADRLGAQAFNRLVVLCAGKTAAARKLLDELSTSWRPSERGSLTRSLPAEPVSAGSIAAWPCCAPKTVGMEKEPLDRVRTYMEWRTRMKHFAGISCGIVRNGSLVYYQDAGFQDAEKKVKMSSDTIVRLFSMTKCLVAAAFFTYYEEPARKIDLDHPVSKYIPAFAKMTVLPKRGQKEPQPCDKPITLRHLLTHTSGIGYGATLDDPWPPEKGSYYKIYEELSENTKTGTIKNLEQWCNTLAKIPLKGQPGRFWDYSYSLDVLGRVLEVISGKTLDQVVEERICAPLKMRDTKFKVPKKDAHRVGPWYRSVEIEGKSQSAHSLEIVDPGGEQSGWVGDNASTVFSGGGTVEVPLAMKGGMVSTFNDYLRFLLMIRNFGELDGVRVLKRETMQMMICNHVPVACGGKRTVFVFDKPGVGYNCLGQIQAQHPKQDKGTYPGEFGWGGLAGPAWTIDPRSDLIILSMTQTAFVLDHEEYVRYAARRSIHQHIFGEVAAPSKATSHPPEIFDVVRAEEKSETEKEFEQEYLSHSKTRVRGAKERAIAPGPRLARHPDDEEVKEYQESLAKRQNSSSSLTNSSTAAASTAEVEDTEPVGKRRRLSAGNSNEKNGGMQSTPQAKQSTPASPGPGSEKQDLLYSRVAIPCEQDGQKKARVTAVNGKELEVVTEGNWKPITVNMADINPIEETQFGLPLPNSASGGPTDFGFLMTKNAKGNDSSA